MWIRRPASIERSVSVQRVNVSQSAVSVHVQKLETELGHALFERRGRTIVLTEAGRITPDLAEHFHAITHSRRFPNPLLRELLGRERRDAV